MKDDPLHQDFGSMPGMNGSPFNTSFRTGSQDPPTGRLWVLPTCTIVAAILIVVAVLFLR